MVAGWVIHSPFLTRPPPLVAAWYVVCQCWWLVLRLVFNDVGVADEADDASCYTDAITNGHGNTRRASIDVIKRICGAQREPLHRTVPHSFAFFSTCAPGFRKRHHAIGCLITNIDVLPPTPPNYPCASAVWLCFVLCPFGCNCHNDTM